MSKGKQPAHPQPQAQPNPQVAQPAAPGQAAAQQPPDDFEHHIRGLLESHRASEASSQATKTQLAKALTDNTAWRRAYESLQEKYNQDTETLGERVSVLEDELARSKAAVAKAEKENQDMTRYLGEADKNRDKYEVLEKELATAKSRVAAEEQRGAGTRKKIKSEPTA
ncbi:hypothetical protein I350_01685 [Cryptococcus amylolentus CBS 6273]|uniref:Uncharacterized protein n=1 Tax=Cryptococcus amylolentus CBS 6273 TaxID=1296118 RepID=A0A1E3KDW8_9TREE|nr:hypothetical protein I350_01685 [Cryptococcus amylolentus CBS 6273]